MSTQRCGKCRGTGHNRLTCGQAAVPTSPTSPSRPLLVASPPPSALAVSSPSPAGSTQYDSLYTRLQNQQEAQVVSKPAVKTETPPAVLRLSRKKKHPDSPFRIAAYVNGEKVGQADFRPTLHGNDAMLDQVWVLPAFQGRGIARQLWEKAKLLGYEPVHSIWRTPEGDAFAKKMGGPMPPNLLEHVENDRPMTAEDYRADYAKKDIEIAKWYETRPPKRVSDLSESS